MSSNLDYYRRREHEERATAAQADDGRIRDIHLEMAGLYARLCTVEAERPYLQQVC
jgi:hypothetical protein